MKPNCVSLLLIARFLPALVAAQTPEVLNQGKKEGEVILSTTMTVRDFEPFNRAAKIYNDFLGIR